MSSISNLKGTASTMFDLIDYLLTHYHQGGLQLLSDFWQQPERAEMGPAWICASDEARVRKAR